MSDFGEVGRRDLAVTTTFQIVGEFLTLVQGREAGALYGTDVHEGILAAIVGLDEAEAFGRVEELYGALDHFRAFPEYVAMQSAIARPRWRHASRV